MIKAIITFFYGHEFSQDIKAYTKQQTMGRRHLSNLTDSPKKLEEAAQEIFKTAKWGNSFFGFFFAGEVKEIIQKDLQNHVKSLQKQAIKTLSSDLERLLELDITPSEDFILNYFSSSSESLILTKNKIESLVKEEIEIFEAQKEWKAEQEWLQNHAKKSKNP